MASAIEGTKNVIESAVKANIKKVVVTSSIAAIRYSEELPRSHLSDNDWSSPDTPFLYPRSKTAAEREAWRLAEKYKNKLNLTVICPGLILGEFLLRRDTPVISLFKNVFGKIVYPDFCLSIVDPYDVALAHVRSLERPEISKNKRYILVENSYWFSDLMMIFREEFQKEGYRIPSIRLPNILSKLALKVKGVDRMIMMIGRRLTYENTPVKTELGINFIHHRDSILKGARSLIRQGKITK